VASHSRSFVREVADDVIYLNEGRVCWQTSKDEFVECGPINELAY
jgi:ABC-type polar amino acid transport system ATPase subunit